MDRPSKRKTRRLVVIAIAIVIATQPFGIFWHFIDDHLSGHAHAAHDHDAAHVGDELPDHDADHSHLWMIPASDVIGAQIGQPQAVAVVTPCADPPVPSAPLLPPFSPPRA